MRDRPAAAKMAEAETVMTIDQDALMAELLFHPR
jgi:hypothetical protein